jgi:hypothetical protein
VKVGDLIRLNGDVGVVLTEPHLSADCEPGGEAYPNETYYLMDVFLPWGTETVATDECEGFYENR